MWDHQEGIYKGLACPCAQHFAEPQWTGWAGGQYAFLREGWGKFVGFLYGWTFFWVINAGTMAALALGFAENLLPLFGVDVVAEKEDPGLLLAVAAEMILLLAVVNHFGVTLGALIQNLSTFAKLLSLGVIVLGGVFVAGGSTAASSAAVAAPAEGVATTLTISGLVGAFMAIFWAYEGWYQLPFNAAELKRPVKGFSEAAIAVIEQYRWPGNVRELENRVKRAVIMADGPLVTPDDLELGAVETTAEAFDLREVREAAETRAIVRAMSYADQNVSKAAELLGVTRPTLYSLFRKYDIPV